MLNITQISVQMAEDNTKEIKAYASVVLEGILAIHDIRIIKKDGVFQVLMPMRKLSDGTSFNIIHNNRDSIWNPFLFYYDVLYNYKSVRSTWINFRFR